MALAARDGHALEELAAELNEDGGRAIAVPILSSYLSERIFKCQNPASRLRRMRAHLP